MITNQSLLKSFKSIKIFLFSIFLLIISNATFSQCSTTYAIAGGTGIGTKEDPAGLYSAIISASDGDIIRVATGVYTFNATCVITANDLTIEGGYDQLDDWSKTSEAGATTINRSTFYPEGDSLARRIMTFKAEGLTGLKFQDLTISTSNVSLYGTSTYGVYLNNCSDYDFVRVQIFSGDAGNGFNGANGADAVSDGVDGANGKNGDCDHAGFHDGDAGGGGAGAGNGGKGGSGSNGGYKTGGSANAQHGTDGQNYADVTMICSDNGNTDGVGYNQNGNNGNDGCDGFTGAYGTIGAAPVYGAYFIPGGIGTTAKRGTGGAGGSGGSGGGGFYFFPSVQGTGAGGSGGGGGGAGGFGGQGSRGGGGSFCLYLFNNGSDGRIEDCYFVNGEAGLSGFRGIGGEGSQGGDGGDRIEGESSGGGGAYCSHIIRDGGAGGDGGNGGNGGNGGISYAGFSAEIVEAGTTNEISPLDITFNLADQDIIIVANPNCINQDVTFENLSGSTDWTFGDDSSPSTATDEVITTTVYSVAGFKDVSTSTETYLEFLHPVCSAEYEAVTDTICNSYYWPVSGETYFDDDTYIYESTTAEGCLRVDTLHLTIDLIVGVPIVDVEILDTLRDECSISAPEPPTATDICGRTITGTTETIFPVIDGDTTVVIWTFDDLVNEVITQEQILIRDSLAPRIPLIVFEGEDAERDNGSSVSLSDYTVPAGQDRILMICLGQNSLTEPSSVEFDGTPATLAHGATNGSDLLNNIYYVLLGSDESAITGDIIVTSATSQKMLVIASDYEFVDQVDPIGSADSTIANDPSIKIEGQSGNTFLEHYIINSSASISEASGQTNINYLSLGGGGQTKTSASFYACYGGLNTMEYNVSGSDEGLHSIVELNFGSLPELTAACSIDPTPPFDAYDNCSPSISATSITSFPVVTDSVITWIYDDGGGNSVTFDQVINITDEVSPSVPFVNYDDNGGTAGGITETLTLSDFEVPAGEDRVLVLFTSKVGAIEVPTILYGETPAIFVDSVSEGSTTSMYYIPLGSGELITEDIVATGIDGGGFHLHAASFNNVDQSTPIGATDKDQGASVALSIEANAGNKLVDYFIHNSPSDPNALSGQTVTTTLSGALASSASYIDAVNGANELNYTGIGSSHYYIGMELIHAKMDTLFAECEITPTVPVEGNDNCSGIITPMSDQPETIIEQGITVVTWDYTDFNGNVSTFEQVVVIDDITDPIYGEIPDVLAECEVTELIEPSSSDNCAGEVIVTNDALLPISGEGTTIVTWTFDDQHGNIVTAAQNIIIDDITPPVGAPISDTLTECEIMELTPPTGTDNCGGELIITHDAILPISGDGTTIVTWTLDDGNGNTSTILQNVIIDDITNPVLDEETLADVTSICQVDELMAPTASDSCSGLITATTLTPFPITDLGTTVVTWTFDDGNGNIITQDQNVIIEEIVITTTTTGITITADQDDVEYSWIDCDNGNTIIPGETEQDFTPTENGSYAVILTSGECSDTSECVQIESVGISTLSVNLKLILYPNPTSDGLFNYDYNGAVAKIQILDLLGRTQVFEDNRDENQINCSTLESGKYYVIIETEDHQILIEEIIILR